jgi:hypothetical protein
MKVPQRRTRGPDGLRRFAGRVAALLFMTGALGACSVNPPLNLSETVTSGAPLSVPDVPFFAQDENQCGPASLAMLLGASGIDLSPEQLSPGVYLPGRQGSLQAELMAATRRAGRIPYPLSPDPGAIIAELEAGRPVLVLQNLRVRTWPAWHYAVVTGADPARNTFVLNSGTTEGLEMSAPHFLRTWNWGGDWAIVALTPGELPARPDPQRYFKSVSDFEAVAGGETAVKAWKAGARQWPTNPVPDLALGNAAYAAGDLRAAARRYREGLSRNPQDPVLANNLATVLGEMGCARAGERVLAPFAARGGLEASWSDALNETSEELAAQQGEDPPSCSTTLHLPRETGSSNRRAQ